MSGPVFINPATGSVVDPVSISYLAYAFLPGTVNQMQWPIFGSGSTPPTNPIARYLELTSSGSCTMVMPDASLRGFSDVLAINSGGGTVQINDFVGNSIIALAPGSAVLMFTTAQTQSGSWDLVNFGSVVSSSNASVLAGAGLMAIGATLNDAFPVTQVNSVPFTLTAAHRATVQAWTGGAGTWTLSSSTVLGNNWFFFAKNVGSGALVIQTSGGDLLDGATSVSLNPNESCGIVCTGSGFITIGRGRSTVFNFSQLVKNVTGGTYTETSTDYANVVQKFTGALTANQIIVLPTVVNVYYVTNATTGAFTLTFQTGFGTSVTVVQSTSTILICDGTNIYAANSVPVGSITSIALASGSALAPTLSFGADPQTGLYLPAVHQLGIAVNGVQTAYFSATNFVSLLPIDGGTF